jgi:hypothetical protein
VNLLWASTERISFEIGKFQDGLSISRKAMHGTRASNGFTGIDLISFQNAVGS